MQATFPLIDQRVAEFSRSAEGKSSSPVPSEKYPRFDRDVLTLLHNPIALRGLSKNLTDTAYVRHIVDNTPHDYVSNLIDFGLGGARAGMEKVWELQIERRFPEDMQAARSRGPVMGILVSETTPVVTQTTGPKRATVIKVIVVGGNGVELRGHHSKSTDELGKSTVRVWVTGGKGGNGDVQYTVTLPKGTVKHGDKIEVGGLRYNVNWEG